LDYQLLKYPGTLKRLKDLKALFCNKYHFYSSPNDCDYKEDHQVRCIDWVNDQLRKHFKNDRIDKAGNKNDKGTHFLPEIKPIFNSEAINTIFDLLKDFFSKEHQSQLNEILQTGNIADDKLFFLDNGNRLADAFKQLIKADIITGCEQKELETWIQKNFCYRYRNNIKEFTPRYLNDIISTNKEKCQKPVLNVKQDKATGKYSIVKA
jgi:hypothetical protein